MADLRSKYKYFSAGLAILAIIAGLTPNKNDNQIVSILKEVFLLLATNSTNSSNAIL